MSSNSKSSAQETSEASTSKNGSPSVSNPDSHKITTFFPLLREGRAKMCASKAGDSKQKEILQKLKDKDTRTLRPKGEDKKEIAEEAPKADTSQSKEKLRTSISVMSALKTPLSQVLRKSIEASSESKKDQVPAKVPQLGEKPRAQAGSQSVKKDSTVAEKAVEDPKPKLGSQKAKKSFQETESGMALRQKLALSNKPVPSPLRSQAKRTVEVKTSAVKRKPAKPDSAESIPIKGVSSSKTASSCSSPVVAASPSPIEDGEHATSNQSSTSGGKAKKNRKRHFRGATYSLFLSKKKKKMNMKKSQEESRDDECSLAGTENSSYFDSEDGNSLMSEDLYTPSEKSLPDEEQNPDSCNSLLIPSNASSEKTEMIPTTDDVQMEEDKSNSEPKLEDAKPLLNEEGSNVADLPQKEDLEWDPDTKLDSEDLKDESSQALKAPQYDDISNESFSNSLNFPFKQSPESSNGVPKDTNEVESETGKDPVSEVADEVKDVKSETEDTQPSEDASKIFSSMFEKEDDSNPATLPQEKGSQLDSSGQEYDNESPASMPTSGDEHDSESLVHMHDGDDTRADPNDAQSTIATCVKSRQRIKRRFTDDIVDTDVGLLSLNSSMAPPRKNPYKPDPPKDVIQTFQSVTRSEAKKGCVTKIECIYNSHQDPIKTCECEGETYEANLGEEDEGVFCQAVDSIDDKLVGCSNPVVTPRLVRSSVKIPFTIMCEMHLWRLRHHHSCPYCGLFCSQGYFMQCTNSKNKKTVHLYHEQCQTKEEGISPFCFHCGSSTSLKRVQLEMHMASPPSFFLSQISKLPVLNGEKARISFSASADVMKKEDEDMSAISYRIEDTGKVLSSVGLPKGPEREELERLLQVMNEEAFTPIYYVLEDFYTAASEGDVLKVLNILAQGIDPNQAFKNHENETALHAAAANGHTTIVHLLIQAGAVNDALNERIYTPLMLAVESNHKDTAFYLVKNGTISDYKGDTGMSSFHIAAKNGNLDILKILMSSRDVNVNAQDDGGWTPIVWASEHDHYDVVKYLLMRGANPNIRDSEGNTGLHWSAFSGSVDICFLYLDFGCDINGVNERGDTPLHIAARQDSLPCVTLFLSRGADVQIKNKAGLTPAECVIDKNSDTYLSLSLNMLLRKIAGKYQHKAEKILHRDISRGKEQIAIQCVNDVDDEPPPLDFLYVTENCETTPMNIDRTITSLQSCHCEDDCSTSTCTCASISYQCWYDKEGLLLPNFNLLDPPMLFECNRACSCWSLNCRNRVLQNGMTCRLQLIRTKGKGWGVRTLKDIPKGTFICEYVGEMISDSAADKRADDSYLFDLDNRDGETYCLDARYYGNISRFINHLCEPNLVPVKVYVDHQDLNFPRIAFFSSRDIKQYEELGFDYCEKFWVIKYKYFTCDCGSPKCKYSKDTIHNTLASYYRRVKEEQMEEASVPGVQELPILP